VRPRCRRDLCVRCALCGIASDDSRQRAGHRTIAGPEPLDVYAGGGQGDGHRWQWSQRDGVYAVRVVIGGYCWRL